jgi:hypothetical protein
MEGRDCTVTDRHPRARRRAVLLMAGACLPALTGLSQVATSKATTPGVAEASVQIDPGQSQQPVALAVIGDQVQWTVGDNLADVSKDGHTYANVAGFLSGQQDIRLLRFPGGLLANCYDWSQGIGKVRQPQERIDFSTGGCAGGTQVNWFGTDEFMSAMAAAAPHAQALLTVNICSTAGGCSSGTGTVLCPAPPTQCPGATTMGANWVQYLNGNAGDPTKPYAVLRAQNGHVRPYGVRYFELGNEIYSGQVRDAATYVQVAAAYASAMRKEDPTVQIGGVLSDPGDTAWDATVAGSGVFDFLIPHEYEPGFSNRYATMYDAPPGFTRYQSFSFSVPAAGTYQLQVDAFVEGGTSGQMTLTVDDQWSQTASFSSVTTKQDQVLSAPGWSLAAGTHHLTIGYPRAVSGSAPNDLRIGGGEAVCTAVCPLGAATPLDFAPTTDNPAAIAILHANAPAVTSITRQLTVSGPSPAIQVQAFGLTYLNKNGTAGGCPSLTIQVDNTTPTTVLLSNPHNIAVADACYSIQSPLTFAVAATAGTHTVTLSESGGADADVVQLAALAGTTTTATADLTPDPGGIDGYSQAVYGTLTHDVARFDRLQQYGLPLIVSEWNTTYAFLNASLPEFENLRSTLWDAAFLQVMLRHQVLGSTFFDMDGGEAFRVYHCSATSPADAPGACASPSTTPYNALPGWMFAMLKGHVGSTMPSTTVSAPSFTASSFVNTDFTQSRAPVAALQEIQALATHSPGRVDVQLVNFAGHAVTVQVSIANLVVNGQTTLTSLSGPPDAVDGCTADSRGVVTTCTPDQITPQPQPAPAGQATMTITLPATSFSVLSVPVAG